MSFYFDDEPQQEATQDDDFVCLNCGGTDSYVDPIGGSLCCTSCFTQSQQLTQESTQLDIEEVQALAARTKTGRVVENHRAARGGVYYKPQEKKPLVELDKSTPFPNLITCIHGIQQVMKHCIERLCDLVGLSNEIDVVEETVQNLWMSYLRAWTDGAEFYGKLHPEIRFSLRDAFFPYTYKNKVLKYLSHQAAQTVRAEMNYHAGEEKKQDESIGSTMNAKLPTHESDYESDDSDTKVNHASLPIGHQRTIAYFESKYHKARSLMWMYWHQKGKRGRLETALITVPSMKFVACLLFMAVSRAGVTLNHVWKWVANGALPLQNAFSQCLSESEQEALMHFSSFFRISKIPPIEEMETFTNRLVVACGLKSFAHLHGLPTAAAAVEPTTTRDTPDAVASRYNGFQSIASKIRERPDFSYVTPLSVPLLTARLIKDLRFGQDILDRTFGLMGIIKNPPANLWLCAPLERALPKNLATTAQVLAVIAVACRMTPGWETWSYPSPSAPNNYSNTAPDDKSIGAWESLQASKRRRIESESNRFVPYNEDNFRLLRNGSSVKGYLDFLESHFLDESEAIFPKFRSTLESKRDGGEEDGPTPTSISNAQVVQKQPDLKRSRDPFGGEQVVWRRQKLHDWKLRLKRKRARWADANGLGEYVIYNDPLSHVQERKRGRGKNIHPTPEPFHPHYGLLLEYMSFTTNVKTSKIHAAITVLDEEIWKMMRPKEEPKQRRRKAPANETSVPTEPIEAVGELVELSLNVGEETEEGNDNADPLSSSNFMVEV